MPRKNECIEVNALPCEHLTPERGRNRILLAHVRTFRNGMTQVLCSNKGSSLTCTKTGETCVFETTAPNTSATLPDMEELLTELPENFISLEDAVREFKRRLTIKVLNACAGNISATGRALGVDRKTIQRFLK